MPAKDGTGPMSQGSRTGRGMGNCASTKVSNTQRLIPVRNNLLDWVLRFGDAILGQTGGRGRQNRGNRK